MPCSTANSTASAKRSGASLTSCSRGRRIFRSASEIPSAAPLNAGVRLFTNTRLFVLHSSMLITLLKSIGAGFLMAVLLMLPFFGPFTVGLLLFPICLVPLPYVQQFCKSSEYVEFGFAWITIHSKAPFFFYWAWFSIVALALYKISDFRLTGKQSSS
jgi:hypothetical protein